MVKLFIEVGADVNWTGANMRQLDIDGVSPLWNACAYGHLNIVKLLVEKGKANIHKATTDGRPPSGPRPWMNTRILLNIWSCRPGLMWTRWIPTKSALSSTRALK